MQHQPESGEERLVEIAEILAEYGYPDLGEYLRTEVIAKAPLEQEATQALHDENEANFERAERAEAALREIVLHHEIPAGEAWEASYNDVCETARAALRQGGSDAG